MPDRDTELEHLEQVDRQIAEGEARVLAQRKLLEDLRRDGHSTELAEQTLEALEGAVKAARGVKIVIEETLRGLEQGNLPASE